MYSCWNICAEHDDTRWNRGGRGGGAGEGRLWGRRNKAPEPAAGAQGGSPHFSGASALLPTRHFPLGPSALCLIPWGDTRQRQRCQNTVLNWGGLRQLRVWRVRPLPRKFSRSLFYFGFSPIQKMRQGRA